MRPGRAHKEDTMQNKYYVYITLEDYGVQYIDSRGFLVPEPVFFSTLKAARNVARYWGGHVESEV